MSIPNFELLSNRFPHIWLLSELLITIPLDLESWILLLVNLLRPVFWKYRPLLISSRKTQKPLVELSNEIGKMLRKKIIPSKDVAGFIGNVGYPASVWSDRRISFIVTFRHERAGGGFTIE